MTRRAFLALPFIAPLAKLLGLAPEPYSRLPSPERALWVEVDGFPGDERLMLTYTWASDAPRVDGPPIALIDSAAGDGFEMLHKRRSAEYEAWTVAVVAERKVSA